MSTTTHHDPALKELFGNSRKSYEENKQSWLEKLEASAARARARKQLKPATGIAGADAVVRNKGFVLVIQAKALPPHKGTKKAAITEETARKRKAKA